MVYHGSAFTATPFLLLLYIDLVGTTRGHDNAHLYTPYCNSEHFSL